MANVATCALLLKSRVGRPTLTEPPSRTPASSLLSQPPPAAPRSLQGGVAQWLGSPAGPKIRAATALMLSLAVQGHSCVWVEAPAAGITVLPRLPAGWAWAATGVYPAFRLRETSPTHHRSAATGSARSSPVLISGREQRIKSALRAVEQLLTDRRWAAVVLHLGRWAPSELREIPKWTWTRLQEAADLGGSTLILLADRRCRLFGDGEVRWFGADRLPLAQSPACQFLSADGVSHLLRKQTQRLSRPARKSSAAGPGESPFKKTSGGSSLGKPFLVPRPPTGPPSADKGSKFEYPEEDLLLNKDAVRHQP